eukprot:TRINITY_DN601_c0_g1_i1.p1 TRINITY_DN601_c0_g1~~TRINITY_DN601_c0_g1_i1.p1  ORF type:complete len:554 (+),score=69.77 TRINITY_DN601_c0_g1_i1:754-2415(+)
MFSRCTRRTEKGKIYLLNSIIAADEEAVLDGLSSEVSISIADLVATDAWIKGHVKEIVSSVSSGKTVVIQLHDVWHVHVAQLERALQSHGAKAFSAALLYRSIPGIVEKFKAMPKKPAALQLLYWMIHFGLMFRGTLRPTEQTVDRISRKSIRNAIEQVESLLHEEGSVIHTDVVAMTSIVQQFLFAVLSLDGAEEEGAHVHLEPRLPYDFIVNVTKLSPAAVSKRLLHNIAQVNTPSTLLAGSATLSPLWEVSSMGSDCITTLDPATPTAGLWPPCGECLQQLQRSLDASTTLTKGKCNVSRLIYELLHHHQHSPLHSDRTVYEHSLWTARYIDKLIATNNVLAEGLPQELYPVAILAGFVHDIGKVGDGITQFRSKTNHPQAGSQMLAGEKPIKWMSPGPDLTLHEYLDTACGGALSKEDLAILSVSTATHMNFGDLLMGKITEKEYIDKLKFAKDKFRPATSHETLARLCILVSVGDMRGLQYVHHKIRGGREALIAERKRTTPDISPHAQHDWLVAWQKSYVDKDGFVQPQLLEKRQTVLHLATEFDTN